MVSTFQRPKLSTLTMRDPGALLSMDIKIGGGKKWDDLDINDPGFFKREMGTFLREIRERTISGQLSDGSRAAALSKTWAKRKQRSFHARPIRDGVASGDMWTGFGFRPVRVASASGTAFGVRLGFSGAHVPTGKMEYRTKKGQTRQRGVPRQLVANNWALFAKTGAKEPLGFGGRPGHVFIELDPQQTYRLEKRFGRVIDRKFGMLVLDPKQNVGG